MGTFLLTINLFYLRFITGTSEGWYDGGENNNCLIGCAAWDLVCTNYQMRAHNWQVDTSSELKGMIKSLGGNVSNSECDKSDFPAWKSDGACHVSDPNIYDSYIDIDCRTLPESNWNRLCFCHHKPSPSTAITPTLVPSIAPTFNLHCNSSFTCKMELQQQFTIAASNKTAWEIMEGGWINSAIAHAYNVIADDISVWPEYIKLAEAPTSTSTLDASYQRRRSDSFRWEVLTGDGCGAYPVPNDGEHGKGCEVDWISETDCQVACQNSCDCVAFEITGNSCRILTQVLNSYSFICPLIEGIDFNATANYKETLYGRVGASGGPVKCINKIPTNYTLVITYQIILYDAESMTSIKLNKSELSNTNSTDKMAYIEETMISEALDLYDPFGLIYENVTISPVSIISTDSLKMYNCSIYYNCDDHTFVDPCSTICTCSSYTAVVPEVWCGRNCYNEGIPHCHKNTWVNFNGDEGGTCAHDGDAIGYWHKDDVSLDECIEYVNARPSCIAYSFLKSPTPSCQLYTVGEYLEFAGGWNYRPMEHNCSDINCIDSLSAVSAYEYQVSCNVRSHLPVVSAANDKQSIAPLPKWAYVIIVMLICVVTIVGHRSRKWRSLIGEHDSIEIFIGRGVKERVPEELIENLLEGFPKICYSKLTTRGIVGSGASGEVLKATYLDEDRICHEYALKMLSDSSEWRCEELLREMSVAYEIKTHPNVVDIIGWTMDNTARVGLVLPFYELGSLMEHLYGSRSSTYRTLGIKKPTKITKTSLKFDMVAKLFLIRDIADGIQHLHNHDIIHRDIAARNILLHKDAFRVHAVITDFGISMYNRGKDLIGEPRRSPLKPLIKNRKGAPRWMPKEAINKAEFSRASDIYGFAITCWEILYEKKPYDGKTVHEAARFANNGGRPHLSLDMELNLGDCANSPRTMLKFVNPRDRGISAIYTSKLLISLKDLLVGPKMETVDQDRQTRFHDISMGELRKRPPGGLNRSPKSSKVTAAIYSSRFWPPNWTTSSSRTPFVTSTDSLGLTQLSIEMRKNIEMAIKTSLEWMVKDCWAEDSKARPTISVVVAYLNNIQEKIFPDFQADQYECLPSDIGTNTNLRDNQTGCNANWNTLQSMNSRNTCYSQQLNDTTTLICGLFDGRDLDMMNTRTEELHNLWSNHRRRRSPGEGAIEKVLPTGIHPPLTQKPPAYLRPLSYSIVWLAETDLTAENESHKNIPEIVPAEKYHSSNDIPKRPIEDESKRFAPPIKIRWTKSNLDLGQAMEQIDQESSCSDSLESMFPSIEVRVKHGQAPSYFDTIIPNPKDKRTLSNIN